jgi:hypothetical protein
MDLEARMRAKLAELMGNNEDQTVKGKTQVHPDPADRKPGTIDARWGDKPSVDHDGYPNDHSSGVTDESNKDRHGVLSSLFEDMGAASTADQALVNQYFSTPSGERRTPHSPLLHKEAEQLQKPVLTLREQTRGIFGG